MEVLAVHPSMSDDFTTEPLFVRRTLDDPLEWTGVLPPDGFVARVEAAAGVSLRRICEGLDA